MVIRGSVNTVWDEERSQMSWGTCKFVLEVREVDVHRTNEGDFGYSEISLAHTWTDKQAGTYIVLK